MVRTKQVRKVSTARSKSHGHPAQVNVSAHQSTIPPVDNTSEPSELFNDEDITVEVINKVPGNPAELDISALESLSDNHAESGKGKIRIASVCESCESDSIPSTSDVGLDNSPTTPI